MSQFSYDLAFDRNIGWVTEGEQLALRGKRVAIAGMGGVGGIHLLTLARFGVGAFTVADFDRFDIVNFNRQAGATMETIGLPKAAVMEGMARSINPELRVTRFDAGVDEGSLDSFLAGADLFIDGLDFFVIDIRRRIFARCRELGIPALTAAPIGMGTAYLAFVPGGMSFEQYFRLEGCAQNEQYLRFLLGLTPSGLHRSYLVDPSRLDLAAKKGPSTIVACQLCAGVTGATAVKLLLGRGDLKAAPYYYHFDAYLGRLVVSKLPSGNAGAMQKAKLALARRMLGAKAGVPPEAKAVFIPRSPIEEILNAARWAPSGDNEQPWRFEIVDDSTVRVRLAAHSADNVYEYRDGEPLLLAGGMLLETMRIAASFHGRRAEWERDGVAEPARFIVRLPLAGDETPDPLYSYLGVRSVDRRPYSTDPLTTDQRSELEAALGDELAVDWYPERRDRWEFARLSAMATDIRLRAPETFPVHQRIIDWQRRLSPDRIPAGALGLDSSTLRIMRWAMQSKFRSRLLNRLGGTATAALQMDYAPILRSAAFFVIRRAAPQAVGDETIAAVRAGENIQRFWLTATKLGLAVQPAMAVLIFAHYGAHGIRFSADSSLRDKATGLAARLVAKLERQTGELIFMGRIGRAPRRTGVCRSTRRPLPDLMAPRSPKPGDMDSAPGAT